MNIAMVGCGFIADYYIKTLKFHPELHLVGLYDHDQTRLSTYSKYYSIKAFHTFEEMLMDKNIHIIVNLTNPKNHYLISKMSLEHGKHVYSEKPLAMKIEDAENLVNLAEDKGLLISSAPCNLLSQTSQTIWKALSENIIGKVRLVYAEIDDGLLYKMNYKKWLNSIGIPWPYQDEFEVGCTLEHAAYYLTLLVAYFGPAVSVTAFSSCIIENKDDCNLNVPDFSVACIKFSSGVIARLTCSVIAPHDHKLKIIGDKGNLYTNDCWYYDSRVYIKRNVTIRRKTFEFPWKITYPLVGNPEKSYPYRAAMKMDFCRGISEMVNSIKYNRACLLSPRFSLHVNEISLAIHNASEFSTTIKIKSKFDSIEPLFNL